MPVGTQDNPLTSIEPMKVASALMTERFPTVNQGPGLREFMGDFYEWYGGRWQVRTRKWLEDAVWRALEDAHYRIEYRDGRPAALRRYKPTIKKVKDVMRALESKVSLEQQQVPCWLRTRKKGQPPPAPRAIIAFDDVLLDAATGRTHERKANWFDTVTLPCEYAPDAKCPRWMKCLQEWSDNDEVWITLLRQWMGYCLMPHREYARWMLFHGKIRAGKGTISRVIRSLIGYPGFMASSLDDLADQFGLDGVEQARVLSIAEVNDLDHRDGEKAVRVIKNIVGDDPLTVNAKYKRQVRNVVVRAAPMVQSNSIPRLPNKGRGLSSKMLVLPFDVSFEKNPEYDLLDTLRAELPGIAAWAASGAIELEQAPTAEKFPHPERSREAIHQFHLGNNPFDYFLEARFTRNPEGYVATTVVRRVWKSWLRANKVRIHVPEHLLAPKLVTESSWDLKRVRIAAGSIRAIAGLSVKKESDDDI